MCHRAVEQVLQLHPVQILVLEAQPLGQGHALTLVISPAALSLQRERVLGGSGLIGLQDLLLAHPHPLRELLHARRAAELVLEHLRRLLAAEVQLLQAPRDADSPGLVTEVALDLPDDRRGGEGGELEPARGVEALDRQEEPYETHLHHVLEWLSPPLELASEEVDQVGVAVDQLLADRRVPVPLIFDEELTQALSLSWR